MCSWLAKCEKRYTVPGSLPRFDTCTLREEPGVEAMEGAIMVHVHVARMGSTRGGGATCIYRSLFLAVLGEHGEVSPVGAGAAS